MVRTSDARRRAAPGRLARVLPRQVPRRFLRSPGSPSRPRRGQGRGGVYLRGAPGGRDRISPGPLHGGRNGPGQSESQQRMDRADIQEPRSAPRCPDSPVEPRHQESHLRPVSGTPRRRLRLSSCPRRPASLQIGWCALRARDLRQVSRGLSTDRRLPRSQTGAPRPYPLWRLLRAAFLGSRGQRRAGGRPPRLRSDRAAKPLDDRQWPRGSPVR